MTRAQLQRLIEKHGGTLEVSDEGRSVAYLADAPAGYVWAGTDLHCVVESAFKGAAAWAEEARRELASRITGVEPCTQPDCDICEENAG